MNTDPLSSTFAALADPTRRAILGRLVNGECSVSELAAPFDMSLPAVSKHLKVLEEAGLISRRREAQWRQCRIQAAPLQKVADWAESYRHLWEDRFDRLGAYLEEVQAQDKPKTKTKNQSNDKQKEKSHGRKHRPKQ